MYMYGIQCDFMQKDHQKHSKKQNRLFSFVIWAPELKNHTKGG